MVYLKAYEFWVLDFLWWEEVSTMLDGTASSERGMSMWPCGPFLFSFFFLLKAVWTFSNLWKR